MADEGLVSLEACHSYCPCRDAFSSEHRHGDFSCAGDLTQQVDGPRIWLWVKTRNIKLTHGYSSPPKYGIGFKPSPCGRHFHDAGWWNAREGICIFHSFLSICCGLAISRLEIQACSSRKHTKLYAASTIPKRVAEELWPKKVRIPNWFQHVPNSKGCQIPWVRD